MAVQFDGEDGTKVKSAGGALWIYMEAYSSKYIDHLCSRDTTKNRPYNKEYQDQITNLQWWW